MGRVSRQLLAVGFTLSIGSGPVAAQDHAVGAGRVELGAFPGGGLLFTQSTHGDAPDFANYTIGASLTWNAHSFLALEGEGYFAVGGHKNVDFAGQMFHAQAMPDAMVYSGNLVVTPAGNMRAFVPYAVTGLGALELLRREGTETIGITSNRTLLTANVGGGLKWYAAHGWGIRGDYRFLTTRGGDDTPMFFGQNETRYAHRVSAGLFATF
jgi:hypothetical protein